MQGFKKVAGTPVICMMNGGGIRADLPAGEVTFGDVATVLPFGNFVEVIEVTGAQLRTALEWGYDSVFPACPHACVIMALWRALVPWRF